MRKMKYFSAIILFLLACVGYSSASLAGTDHAKEERNKKTVVEFYNKIFAEKNFSEAKKYFGSTYTQHNPHAPDGPDALESFLKPFWEKYPNAHSEIKRVFADGDYVILHVLAQAEPNDKGRAIVDIFRLDGNGKVVEHWDVIQQIPETSNNSNTMF